MGALTCVYFVGQGLILSVFLCCLFLFMLFFLFFRQGLFLNLELSVGARLFGEQALGILLSSPPPPSQILQVL